MNLSIVTKEMFGDNEMTIYENENKDIFMTREQIGQALEYKHPRRAIADIHNRNKERLDKFSGVSKLRTPQGLQETYIYNEKGIYEIIRRSTQPKADEFYDWIYDLLSKLRKQEVKVVPNNRKLLLETALAHEKEIENIKTDVKMLKDTMRIDSREESIIQRKANRVVIKSLGGKKSHAYKTMSRKAFSRFWGEFKRYFNVPRYGDIPKKEFDKALTFIENWQPDTTTRMEIESANKQMSINDAS